MKLEVESSSGGGRNVHRCTGQRSKVKGQSEVRNVINYYSRPPVLDCGTTFHPDYGGRGLPSSPSDNLSKLIYLATEALSDSFECIGAIKISLSIYLSIY